MLRSVALGFVLVLCAGIARGEEIRTLGGAFDEELISIGGSPLTLKTAGHSLPLGEVKAVRFQQPPSQLRGTKVLLVNGDSVRGVISGGSSEGVTVRSGGLGEVTISFDYVRALIPETSPELERQLEASIQPGQTVDSVVQKDATYEGGVKTIQPGRVVIDTDEDGGSRVGTHSLRLAEVQMVTIGVFDDPPADPEGLHVGVVLLDGSRLHGELVGYSGGVLQLKHFLGGGEPLSIESSHLAELAVKNGAFVYVSDLDPSTLKQEFPAGFLFDAETWGYKRDSNVTGGPLKLGGQVFEKGLGVHSYSELNFRLDGKFARFRTQVGLDDSVRRLGMPGFGGAVFRVLLDGKPAKEVGEAGLGLSKGSDPKRLDVDVSGVQTLTLIVDFDPTSLHVLGRANWADAHLIRSK
ncbi:MAG: NPCBM/NEW2 domain-containing protein [Planctomycetota bacterium]